MADHHRRSIIDTAVGSLRDRLKQIGECFRKIGEENTKRVLITPLLEALNWNVMDLDEVQNEYRAKSQDNLVDSPAFWRKSTARFSNHGCPDRRTFVHALPQSSNRENLAKTNGFKKKIIFLVLSDCFKITLSLTEQSQITSNDIGMRNAVKQRHRFIQNVFQIYKPVKARSNQNHSKC
ncbi:MAG: hypothetical protein HQL07_16855 [Nitrospirae bacterium]|nr:hypothetical protein [Magnetococcales bacterium]HAT51343.1 hypothetical protein [Alphaproteobacteria bacterium]